MKKVYLTLISFALSFLTAFSNLNNTYENDQNEETIAEYSDDDINNPNDSDPNVIYETDFDNQMTGGIPEGWITYNEAGYHLYGFHDGNQYNYNWGGYPGGGGSRLYEGFSGDFNKAMYWGSRGSNEGYATYGEQVKDYMLEGGVIDPNMPEGIALKLEARKYQISFLMAAWKNEPTFTFTLEDLNGNVYARYTDLVAAPNLNGVISKVTGSVSIVKDLTISDPGYYVLRFTAAEAQWQEYLLANVKIITRCDCQVNGIYYNLDETTKTACVTSNMRKPYYGSITIPSTIFYKGTKYTVNGIEGHAFSNCCDLTSITIPNSITTIGNSAFSGCNGLLSIEIPNSVTNIEPYAFNGCSSLTSVEIPNSVISIGDCAFSGTAWYNNQPDGVVYAGKVAYKYKGTMPTNTSITIKEGTLEISSSAFSGCSGLITIEIPNSMTRIGNDAFSGCSRLNKVIVKDISAWCNISFDDYDANPLSFARHLYSDENTEIIELTIPNSVTSIGDYAFVRCSSLTSIDIPSSVTSIGNNAFSNCSGLTSVSIGNGVTSIGDYAFWACSSLTSVVIPSSVTSIGERAFLNCRGLTSVVIPSSVTSIGDYAFSGCRVLTSVVIPSSVTSIGERAFFNCRGLTSITSYITEVFETGDDAFEGCGNATLYVPKGLVDIYKSTSDWNRITNIEEIPDIIQLALACNDKGKVLINGSNVFTNDMGNLDVYDGVNNTFVFLPGNDCKLKQVLVNGEDVTGTVKDNQLITTISEGSKMYVNFAQTDADVNGDGNVDISDVVALVNIILGQ